MCHQLTLHTSWQLQCRFALDLPLLESVRLPCAPCCKYRCWAASVCKAIQHTSSDLTTPNAETAFGSNTFGSQKCRLSNSPARCMRPLRPLRPGYRRTERFGDYLQMRSTLPLRKHDLFVLNHGLQLSDSAYWRTATSWHLYFHTLLSVMPSGNER